MKRRTRQRKPLNIRPVMDPRDPATWGPAPADRPKPGPCPIQAMVDRGAITGPEHDAAREIDRVFRYITQGLMAKAQTLARQPRGEVSPSEAIAIAYAKRYKPWADALTEKRNRHDDPTLEVVISAVVDGMSMRELDASRIWRKGSAATCFRNGLRLYAVMAGWQKAAGTYGEISEEEAA